MVLIDLFHHRIHQVPDRPSLFEPVEKNDTQSGGNDSGKYVEDVMVAGIDGCKPDTEDNDDEEYIRDRSEPVLDSVIKHDQRVGRMQRRHGGENVGALAVDRLEDRHTKEFVEMNKLGRIAERIPDKACAVVLDVPGWCSWIKIVADEAEQVDQQEGHQKIEKLALSSFDKEKNGESHRHGHPKQVKQSAHHIEKYNAIGEPVFVWGDPVSVDIDTEPVEFELIELFNGNVFVQVVRKGFQIVVKYPKDDKDREADDEFPGDNRNVKEKVEDHNEGYLVGLKPNKQG